jgi:hypothetical protein
MSVNNPKRPSIEKINTGKYGVMTTVKPKYIWRALGIFLAIILLILIVGKPPWYTAKPISAVVVDFDTKKPVEDAVVVAIWILEKGTLAGSYITGVLEAEESISDKNGRFHIEGWGLKFLLYPGVCI